MPLAHPFGSMRPCSLALPAPIMSAGVFTVTPGRPVVSAVKVWVLGIIRLCRGSGTQSCAPLADTVYVPPEASEWSMGAVPFQVLGVCEVGEKLTGVLA